MNEEPAIHPMNLAPRCGANNRSGASCKAPAMRGRKRCRLHGGKSTGAPKGNRNAYKHGLRSCEMRAMREMVRLLQRDSQELF